MNGHVLGIDPEQAGGGTKPTWINQSRMGSTLIYARFYVRLICSSAYLPDILIFKTN